MLHIIGNIYNVYSSKYCRKEDFMRCLFDKQEINALLFKFWYVKGILFILFKNHKLF